MSSRFNHSSKISKRRDEYGGSTAKFLIVLVALFLIGHAAFNYIMVWYQCTHFQDSMTQTITQAYAIPNAQLSSPDYIKQKLRKIGDEDNVPVNAIINVQRGNNGTEAQVSFTREINLLPFNLYKYKYEFNHVATPPSGFLTK